MWGAIQCCALHAQVIRANRSGRVWTTLVPLVRSPDSPLARRNRGYAGARLQASRKAPTNATNRGGFSLHMGSSVTFGMFFAAPLPLKLGLGGGLGGVAHIIHALFFRLNARSRQMKPAVGVRFNVVRFMPSIIRANCICGSGANREIVRFTKKSRNHAVGGR